MSIVNQEKDWNFNADGERFRLVSEAYRIQMAHLFDPMLAIHSSLIDPLPHQIQAVYEKMLPKQPLRFLLADDPGAGKTIMAGLLIKELMLRGDVQRCLVCTPSNLDEQWQEEMASKFQLSFDCITSKTTKEKRLKNPFLEKDLVICRIDFLSRNKEAKELLEQTDWDLIIVDEAHKMSASFYGGEIKATKRYRLGELLSRLTRHLLLMTATPHNGKDEDFQLFLKLLDEDRFEGRFRDGVDRVEISDIMHRLTKEQLLTFQGTPLFPERRAYTVSYQLSPEEEELYREVTQYVRDQWNRVERLQEDGRKKRNVGLALTILQRRLASSPEAIYQSLYRRRLKLEKWLQEGKQSSRQKVLSDAEISDWEEIEDSAVMEMKLLSSSSFAQTEHELREEIEVLKRLERKAKRLRDSGRDRKWEELSLLLQREGQTDHAQYLVDSSGNPKKLVIFTEHRDTLNYLAKKIRALLGRKEVLVTIDGQMNREQRQKAQALFNEDKNVLILLATDAASEGINLHRAAHLMVNYDLPWNPNRLEQRFGRIHRIGQKEVCHLWNLVAENTREGEVYYRLLTKLEAERQALNGAVFDILGKVFQGNRLRDLLIEAVRYGDREDVKQRLFQTVDAELDHEKLRQLLSQHALFHQPFDEAKVQEMRERMEHAKILRLQPNFVESFFCQAFQSLGWTLRQRESGRYEIRSIPNQIRKYCKNQFGVILPNRYKRICFDKRYLHVAGKPDAEYLCSGHPVFDAVVQLVLERDRSLLEQGTILVDEGDEQTTPRLLVYLEHEIVDESTLPNGNRRVVSRQVDFLEIDEKGQIQRAGIAPYLDYRSIRAEEREHIRFILQRLPWSREQVEQQVKQKAIEEIIPVHFKRVKSRREEQIAKTRSAVKQRLQREINYWDHRVSEWKELIRQGKPDALLQMRNAQERADELHARLKKRLHELEQEERLSPRPPRILAMALVVPRSMLVQTKPSVSIPQFVSRSKED